MKHSIMRMEAAPVRDPAANAGAGTLYMVVEEVWCLAGGGGGSTLDTVATTDMPCYAAQPWPPPWLRHQGQEIPSQATKILW